MGLLTVTNSTDTIVIGDSSGVTPNTSLNKKNIVSVDGYFQANIVGGMGQAGQEGGYGHRTVPRTTKTIVVIKFTHKGDLIFDCDDVTNQVGWQGCTQTALNQALSDINSWL